MYFSSRSIPGMVLALAAGCAPFFATTQSATELTEHASGTTEQIVLRDLTRILDDPIESFDERGIVLASQKQIGWSKVMKANVAVDRQMEFNRYLNELGLPLFRLESRLRKSDWAGVGEIAEPLYEALLAGKLVANEEYKFLICKATMEGRLYDGKRKEAVQPFLRAAAHQTRMSPESQGRQKQLLLPATDVTTMVSEKILPIWFDRAGCMTVFSQLKEAIDNDNVSKTSGAMIYFASLAVAAENYGLADKLIVEVRNQRQLPGTLVNWLTIIEATRKLGSGDTGQGRALLDQLLRSSRPVDKVSAPKAVARFLVGRHQHNDSVDTQLINLLSIPAIYGNRYPSLSAAALYEAFLISRKKSDPKQSQILANELLRRYPNTYHGRLAAIEK